MKAQISKMQEDNQELQAMLLSRPSTLKSSTADSNLRAKLAETNRDELENRLSELSEELEKASSQLAVMNARCRDQAKQIESLNVANAALRSNAQKMHLSALETLSAQERMEYDSKKSILKSDYDAQLHDFEQQEADALLRHQARIRASSERRLDELRDNSERAHRKRIEQLDKANDHAIERLKADHEDAIYQLKREFAASLNREREQLVLEHDRRVEKIKRSIHKVVCICRMQQLRALGARHYGAPAA